MKSPRSRRRLGFTLMEMAIGVTLMTVVLGGTVIALQRGWGLYRWIMATGDLESRAARGVHKITRNLLGAGTSSLSPDLTTPAGSDTVWSETIDLQIGEDWSDSVVWGEARQITLELANGELDNDLDDDGDGLIDEYAAVLVIEPGTANERRAVLVNGVSEYLEGETANGADDNGNGLVDERGLAFYLDGDLLMVELTVQRQAPDGSIMTRSQISAVGLRN